MTLAAREGAAPDSPVARWDARWKLAGVLVAAFGTAALRSPGPAAAALAAALLLAGLGRVPAAAVAGRLGLLLLSVAPFLVVLPLAPVTGDPVWRVGPVPVSKPGATEAAAVALRVLAVGTFALVLTRTAPLPRTLAAAHALGAPGVLVQIAQVAHRYTGVLAGEARRTRVALRARGFRAGTDRHTYKTLGHAAGALLARGGDRADRVAAAMRARGFDGVPRPLAPFRTTPADVLSFVLLLAGTITLVAADLRVPSDGPRMPSGEPGPARQPVLGVRNLTHVYPDGRPALAGVTLAVGAGDRVAVVGPNGAGKTTLFLRLCGVLPGRPGEAAVAGLDPADPGHRRKLPGVVGAVFQNPDDQLFSATVLEDVAFGPLNLGAPPAEARARAEEALGLVGLAGAGDRPPHRLSGGEKRRAALAGVLAMRPEVLLLDEPTMFLDPRGRRELIRLLAGLPGTLVVATHDLDLVLDLCPRAVVLDAGRVAADGPARDLLADPDLMTRHGLEVPGRLLR